MDLLPQIKILSSKEYTAEENEWANDFATHIRNASHRAKERS